MTVDDFPADNDDVASGPNDAADPQHVVEARIPNDIRRKYEVYSYRSAAIILAELHKSEFTDILEALRAFEIDTQTIRAAGGNESAIPKLFSKELRPRHWFETSISGDLIVKLAWRQTDNGRRTMAQREIRREKYLDGHKIDYVKNKVAFDLEWNSKDQTFDRDLYAFNAFFLSGAIDVAVLVTRSAELNTVLRSVGPALNKDGEVIMKGDKPSSTWSKYGASTTWMGKLLYRLNAGRNGGCPVLAFGIKSTCVTDWDRAPEQTFKTLEVATSNEEGTD
jgi:hypothetical protein